MGLELHTHFAAIFPEAEDVTGEEVARAEEHVAVAASAGDDGVALFPCAGEGDRGAVQVEPFARAVRNDEQAVFPQAAEQFVL